jgi:hypothetical protein
MKPENFRRRVLPAMLDSNDEHGNNRKTMRTATDREPSTMKREESSLPRYITSPAGIWKYLKLFARENRKKATMAEKVLWRHLRNRKLGVHFAGSML